MATRENQGLQAIIIVLTIFDLGLLVGVLLVNNARKTQKARADNAEQQRDAGADGPVAGRRPKPTQYQGVHGLSDADDN